MPLNIPLLRTTLDHIKANPETWDQGTWRCKSGMCFAGWAAQLAGGKWIVPTSKLASKLDDEDATVTVEGVEFPAWRLEDVVTHPSIEGNLAVGHIPHAAQVRAFARDQLGLTESQAGQLFAGSNSLEDLEGYVNEFIAEEQTHG